MRDISFKISSGDGQFQISKWVSFSGLWAFFVQFPISLEKKSKGLIQHNILPQWRSTTAMQLAGALRSAWITQPIIFQDLSSLSEMKCLTRCVGELSANSTKTPESWATALLQAEPLRKEPKLLTVSTQEVTPSTSVPIVGCAAATVFALSISPLAECDVISPTDCSTPLSLAQI